MEHCKCTSKATTESPIEPIAAICVDRLGTPSLWLSRKTKRKLWGGLPLKQTHLSGQVTVIPSGEAQAGWRWRCAPIPRIVKKVLKGKPKETPSLRRVPSKNHTPKIQTQKGTSHMSWRMLSTQILLRLQAWPCYSPS